MLHPTEKLRIYDKGFDRPPEFTQFGEFLTVRQGDIHIPHLDSARAAGRSVPALYKLHPHRPDQVQRLAGLQGVIRVTPRPSAPWSSTAFRSPWTSALGAAPQA